MSGADFVQVVRDIHWTSQKVARNCHNARAILPPRLSPREGKTILLQDACEMRELRKKYHDSIATQNEAFSTMKSPGSCCAANYPNEQVEAGEVSRPYNSVLFWNMVYVIEELRGLLNEAESKTTKDAPKNCPLTAHAIVDGLSGHASGTSARENPLVCRFSNILP